MERPTTGSVKTVMGGAERAAAPQIAAARSIAPAAPDGGQHFLSLDPLWSVRTRS
jgi:hypothetical protein